MKRAVIVIAVGVAETRNVDDPGPVIETGNVGAVVLGQDLKNEARKGPGLVKEKGGPDQGKVVKRGPGLGTVKGPDVQGLGSLNKKEVATNGAGLRLKTNLRMVWVMMVTHKMTMTGIILNRNVVRTKIVNRSTLMEVMTMKGIE